MVNIIAEFTVRSEQLKEAEIVIKEFVNQVKSEPDTLFYDAFRLEGTNKFIHTMCFRNEAAKEHHSSTTYVNAFAARLYPMCEADPVFTNLDLVASKTAPTFS